VAHRCIALEAFSNVWVCSCKCHSDWLVQTVDEAVDAVELETKGLGTDVLVLIPMVLGRMHDAIMSLSRHFFLGFGLLCFQKGALRPNMPTETAVMANRRSSDGMRLLGAWNIIIDLFLLVYLQ
jgi:hypothetical protein